MESAAPSFSLADATATNHDHDIWQRCDMQVGKQYRDPDPNMILPNMATYHIMVVWSTTLPCTAVQRSEPILAVPNLTNEPLQHTWYQR